VKEMPQICGFNECSEAGIDVFAPAIFMNGCNFRCPYCMNAVLATGGSRKDIDIELIKSHVLEEKSEWFMISGGEPTCVQIDLLINLLEEIKSWGCKIGMSTNGSKLEVLKKILPMLNYVAMDIKASDEKTLRNLGMENGQIDLIYSKCALTETKIAREDFDYEIRTTLYPEYIYKESIEDIGQILRKDDKWVFQQFRHTKNMLDPKAHEIEPYTEEEVKSLIKIAKNYSDNVLFRYV